LSDFPCCSAVALAAPPTTDWNGTYLYSQSLGQNPPGGPAAFVEHRLTIAPSGCRIVAQGFQTDSNIVCKATPQGSKLTVNFVSFGDGRIEHQYGVRQYNVDQPLFSMTRTADGLVTTCQGYTAADGTKPGPYFKKEGH
jgi:Family of unknown function (DUF5991)